MDKFLDMLAMTILSVFMLSVLGIFLFVIGYLLIYETFAGLIIVGTVTFIASLLWAAGRLDRHYN